MNTSTMNASTTMNNNTNDSLIATTATTTITHPGLELAYPVWEAVLIIIACTLIILGTIVGNVLVCIAVGLVKKLRTPSNLLIVSLAVADLLVAIAVMPLALVYELMGVWRLGQEVCDMWTSLDVLLCTASILNLCMISVDRYFVITRPFDYAIKRTPAWMALMCVSVWILSALISIPPLFGWKSDSKEDTCELSQAIGYQFYATIGAFYLPLTVMIIIYYRIYAVTARLHKKEQESGPIEHKQIKTSASFSAASSSRSKNADNRRQNSFDHAPSSRQKRKNRKESLESSSSSKPLQGRASYTSENNPSSTAPIPPTTLNIPEHSPKPSHTGKILKNVSFRTKRSSQAHNASKERKTTKTLGIIMGAFTACWLPFFILALIAPFLHDPTVIPHWIFSLLQWLGFCNSFLNPIIYARFNRDFRGPFKAILLCKCVNINAYLRTERFTEEYGPSQNDSSGRKSSTHFTT